MPSEKKPSKPSKEPSTKKPASRAEVPAEVPAEVWAEALRHLQASQAYSPKRPPASAAEARTRRLA